MPRASNYVAKSANPLQFMDNEIVKILAVVTNMTPARINKILLLARLKGADSLDAIESLEDLSSYIIDKNYAYDVELVSLRSTRLICR